MARGESKTSPRRLIALERQIQVLRLRAQGYTFQQIAKALGYTSRQGAHSAVSRMVARVTERTTPDSVELLVELERVDSLLVPTLRAALTGDPLAIQLTLAVMDRRAHLLANMR